MDEIKGIIIRRLIDKGIEINSIYAYIRDLTNILVDHTALDLKEINMRLNMLGWDNFELDEHTYQLIMVVLESNGSFELLSDTSGIHKTL